MHFAWDVLNCKMIRRGVKTELKPVRSTALIAFQSSNLWKISLQARDATIWPFLSWYWFWYFNSIQNTKPIPVVSFSKILNLCMPLHGTHWNDCFFSPPVSVDLTFSLTFLSTILHNFTTGFLTVSVYPLCIVLWFTITCQCLRVHLVLVYFIERH